MKCELTNSRFAIWTRSEERTMRVGGLNRSWERISDRRYRMAEISAEIAKRAEKTLSSSAMEYEVVSEREKRGERDREK